MARIPVYLHDVGVEVNLLGPRSMTHQSRFVRAVGGELHDTAAVISALREHLAAQATPYSLVILCDDNLVASLCELRDRSWLKPWFPVDPEMEWLDAIHRKDTFNRFCHAHGLRAPRNIVCHNLDELKAAAVELGYPMMLKRHHGFAGMWVRQADNVGQLEALYAEIPDYLQGEISAQQHIPGRVGDGYVVARRGEMLQWFSYYKTRTWPGRFSPSSIVTTVDDRPDLDAICARLARETGFNGFFGFDWMESSIDGQIYLLEFNPRPTPAIYHGLLFGLDFRKVLPLFWNVEARAGSSKTVTRPGTQRLFPQDCLRCIDERDWLGYAANIRDALLGRSHVPWRDPRVAWFLWKRALLYFRSIKIPIRSRIRKWLKRRQDVAG